MAAKKKATEKPAKRAARPAVKKSARAIKTFSLSRVGEMTKDGEFMSIGRGAAGQPDYYLYRGPTSPKRLNHAAALEFAKACKAHGHKDWELPDRTDGALLYANGRDQAKSAWYWLKPQYAPLDACAWAQIFGHGYQIFSRKSDELEVVLVRRVPIQ
jgi:hypothetical protein